MGDFSFRCTRSSSYPSRRLPSEHLSIHSSAQRSSSCIAQGSTIPTENPLSTVLTSSRARFRPEGEVGVWTSWTRLRCRVGPGLGLASLYILPIDHLSSLLFLISTNLNTSLQRAPQLAIITPLYTHLRLTSRCRCCLEHVSVVVIPLVAIPPSHQPTLHHCTLPLSSIILGPRNNA